YCRINFTGFLKAAKKHDRKRGTLYKVRPLLQVRLAELPFDSEDYSPFLYRLSTMYAFARQTLGEQPAAPEAPPAEGPAVQTQTVQDKPVKETHTYSSYKFWVHEDNLLEVKTLILRRLPVLVYSPDFSSRDVDMPLTDPSFTSLYFDSPRFKLYNQRVNRGAGSTLRLWWRGFLADNPQIFLEHIKTGEDDRISGEVRLPIKEKYIKSFIAGEYSLEKQVGHMNVTDASRAEALQKDIAELQKIIKEDKLQPVLRATYNRTAFQIPGDDRIRVSLDTDVATIREDALDLDRPCRDPGDWHRRDIDNREMTYPFPEIRPGEIDRFPHALLEIRVRDDARKGSKEWLADLMRSHLVKESPRFSKFVHGVAELFEDYVNSFPFWLSTLDTDIRRDPEEFQDERERKRSEDHFAAGSFIGSLRDSHRIPGPDHAAFEDSRSHRHPRGSVTLSMADADRLRKTSAASAQQIPQSAAAAAAASSSAVDTLPLDTAQQYRASIRTYLNRLRPGRRQRDDAIQLPPGVEAPGTWIKDAGPLRVEAKVWLANQRTFLKWQHISVLLATLAVGLYNAAKSRDDEVAAVLAVYSEYQRNKETHGGNPLPVPDRPLWALNVTTSGSPVIENEVVLVNQAAL
ncbi:Phosphate metabolism transcription protein, partial [Ascosphaera pollenicola]